MATAEWLKILADEDLQLIRRLVLASGSLKEVAQQYGVSYPTIRLRLDRLIEKIEIAETVDESDSFRRHIQLLVADGALAHATAKGIMTEHQKSIRKGIRSQPNRSGRGLRARFTPETAFQVAGF
jgi:hypothetical protein